jgi:hypothetical protein
MYDKTKQNEYNKKWREKNDEKWTEINRGLQQRFYEKHKEEKIQKVKGYYFLRKEMELFRRILL